MENDMIERVARAVQPLADPGGDWTTCEDIARAAIEAMCLPTSRMLAGAVMSAVAGDPSAEDYASTGAVLELLPPTGHPQARTVIAEIRRDYRAAMDAALQPRAPITVS